MNNPLKNYWYSLPLLGFLLLGLAVLSQVEHGQEIIALNPWRVQPWNSIFHVLTHLGEFYPYVVLGIVLLFIRYRFAFLLVLGGLITIPVGYVLKDKFAEDRPNTFFEKRDMQKDVVVVPGVKLAGGQTSFPSGHTTSAFVVFGLLTAMLPPKRQPRALAFVLLAALTGFSRIFLVQHFLPDVLGGAVLGTALVLLVLAIDRRFPGRAAWAERRIQA